MDTTHRRGPATSPARPFPTGAIRLGPGLHFLPGKDGEGAEVDVERLSGAWAAKETTRHCNDAWWMGQIEEGRFLELWSFFHEVLSVVRKDNVYTVTVQPTSQGYQFVRFAKSGKDEWESVELVVVTPSGELLETLTEKSGARR